MRVAFTLIGGKTWTGGANFLLNLLSIVGQYQAGRITPVLFVEEDATDIDLTAFEAIPGLELVRTPLLNMGRRQKSLLQSLLLGRDRAVRKMFKEHRIDLVFESARFFGWRLGIPAITWIPDMQHRVLPHLFPKIAWWKREVGFQAQLFGQRSVMVSSEDTKKACEQYYWASRGKIGVVHFAIPPGPAVDYDEARAMADHYGLPEKYIFMPNQFWRHKNHGLVLEALGILKTRGYEIVIVASGMQSDPRDPSYFPTFFERVQKLGLADDFRLLGMIPYPHLALLMRASMAMLNASLFEGWSTTVEEAKSLGTPLILSDIDVHREQMGDNALYFDRNSPQSLADVISTFVPKSPEIREEMSAKARKDAFKRIEEFAARFCEFVETSAKRGAHA